MVKEIKVKVKQWLTRGEFTKGNQIPMRIMVGYIERETPKAYYIHLKGKPMPTSICLHCGRALTHPVSLLYGIGPICGGHFHINPLNSEAELEAAIDSIREKLGNITWSGWVPKSGIEEMEETGLEIEEFNKPTDKSEEKKETKPQPAEQLKTEVKESLYKLEITDSLIDNLFKELEKAL